MKNKTLIATFICSILFTSSKATEYKIIVSQERNDYNIVKDLIPVRTEWIDVGSEYNCVKEFDADNYPLGETFTQNENCSQNQERTVTTTELFNGEPRTTVKTDSRKVDVIISYLDTGLKQLRNMCIDILNRGESIGNGLYTVDHDGNDSIPERIAYCDMTGGGWTLYDTFGTKLVKTGTDNPKAYNYDNINSYATVTAAGYDRNFGALNSTAYTITPYYMQWFLSGGSVGFIKKTMPTWIESVKLAVSNEWYGGNDNVRYGTETHNVVANQPYTEYIFDGGGKEIYMDEYGIVWTDSVWVK